MFRSFTDSVGLVAVVSASRIKIQQDIRLSASLTLYASGTTVHDFVIGKAAGLFTSVVESCEWSSLGAESLSLLRRVIHTNKTLFSCAFKIEPRLNYKYL